LALSAGFGLGAGALLWITIADAADPRTRRQDAERPDADRNKGLSANGR